ncbi:MAG: N-acetylmuramoyl-L-alanine amidase [Oscillospiraceae bacterium]|nr:N-acetylmuramoyl-L-alanine amidase [Oscillospiraceae bacterium]
MKKIKSILYKSSAIFILTCLLLFALISANLNTNRSLAVAFNVKIPKIVVVDAGHGGFDGGATSVYGVLEKDINLKIALKTEKYLKLLGFKVVMTRKDENALAGTKKEDMYKRLEILEENRGAVFVSIHQNLYREQKYSGAQMFYGTQNSDSEKLAQIMQDTFKQNLNKNNNRQVKKAYNDLFLFKNAKQPSVLIECGFLSNFSEAKLLNNEEYQNKIAFSICEGLLKYYSLEE